VFQLNEVFNVAWKSILVFISFVILARMMVTKFLSQLTYFDFVVGIVIGTIGGSYIIAGINNNNLITLLGPVIIVILTIGTAFLTIKSLPARKLLLGEPLIVIQNGKILENNMLKTRYNLNHLEMQLREKNVFDVAEVEFAILEPNGLLSVLKKSQNLPVTMKDMNLPTRYKGVPSEIIKDGQVIEQNLKQNNLDFGWLYDALRKRGIEKTGDVFYASLQTDGTLYIDTRQDNPGYVINV
jgi:uncharacterized membrane protein YcaP (DUF421 family)